MASRTKQKEAARARRIAEERAAADRASRARRTRMLGGVLIAAVAIVAVAIAVSVSGGSSGGASVKPGSNKSQADVSSVSNLLAGIPQSGNTLGNPKAPVTITEYADLECPVCDLFALPTSKSSSDGTPGTGYFDQLVNQYVRTGKAKIVYRSLETATGNGPNASMWGPQQAGVYAAGKQNKAWDYIELFYYQQQPETNAYVNPAFLQGIAQQVPGLNMSTWASDQGSQAAQAQVTNDEATGHARNFRYTPTIVIQGPKGQATPIQSLPSSFSEISSEIGLVS